MHVGGSCECVSAGGSVCVYMCVQVAVVSVCVQAAVSVCTI